MANNVYSTIKFVSGNKESEEAFLDVFNWLEEIGETFDLTRERVRQIKEKAIRRLRHRSRSRKLRQYLG